MNITLDLTLDEVNIVCAGLLELPAKLSLDLIGKIREQAISQAEENKQ